MLPTNSNDCLAQLMSLKKEGLTIDQISERFLQAGVPEKMIREVMMKWKEAGERKRNNAFIYCGIGIGLLTMGFLFTLLFFNSNSGYSFGLYGLTIIGIILVFKGMIDLMS